MSNKLYDILKWVCMVGLPAAACLWYTLGKVWGFPYIDRSDHRRGRHLPRRYFGNFKHSIQNEAGGRKWHR